MNVERCERDEGTATATELTALTLVGTEGRDGGATEPHGFFLYQEGGSNPFGTSVQSL